MYLYASFSHFDLESHFKLTYPYTRLGLFLPLPADYVIFCIKLKVILLSRVQLLATPWTVAYQSSPSMGFSRQEYWSGVPLPYYVLYAYQLVLF